MRGHPRWTIGGGLAVVIVALMALVLVIPSLRRQIGPSFVRQPDRYMELAFVNPLHLPEEEPPGRQVGFRFDLVAHGGEPTRTSYAVTLSVAGGRHTVERSTIATPDDARVTVDAYFVVPPTGDSYTLEVSLPDLHQHLAFHGRAV